MLHNIQKLLQGEVLTLDFSPSDSAQAERPRKEE